MFQVILHGCHSVRSGNRGGRRAGGFGVLALALPRTALRVVRRALKSHAGTRALQALNDHQLRDIGIRREQIPQLVRSGWDIRAG